MRRSAITSVGCMVIRGAGDRAFSAGADLDEIRGLGVAEAQEFIKAGHRTMTAHRVVEGAGHRRRSTGSPLAAGSS